MECSGGSSLRSYSNYFGLGKNTKIPHCGKEKGVLNELTTMAPLRLQLGGQYPYLPYSVDLLNETKFQSAAQVNPPESSVDHHVNSNL